MVSARKRDDKKKGMTRSIESLRVPEFLRILPPDASVGVQGKDRDKHAVSLGNPDKVRSVMN